MSAPLSASANSTTPHVVDQVGVPQLIWDGGVPQDGNGICNGNGNGNGYGNAGFGNGNGNGYGNGNGNGTCNGNGNGNGNGNVGSGNGNGNTGVYNGNGTRRTKPKAPHLSATVSHVRRQVTVIVKTGANGTIVLGASNGKLHVKVHGHGQLYTFTTSKAGKWTITVCFTGKHGWGNQQITRTVAVS